MTNEQADQTIPTPQMLWSLADQSYPFACLECSNFNKICKTATVAICSVMETNQELIGFLFSASADEAELLM